MVVYHGSKELFHIFNYDKIGLNGTSEGKGFYFTNNLSIAQGYSNHGYLYTVEFKGTKSLSSDRYTITKQQLKKYIAELHKITDYLYNWGEVEYSGFARVLNEAVNSEYDGNNNDVDLICGICSACGDDYEKCLVLLYNLLGYDSIVLDAEWGKQKLYIALVNDIIEIKEIQKIA